MEKTYMHTGIPVKEKLDGMVYMAGLKVWISNNEESCCCRSIRSAAHARSPTWASRTARRWSSTRIKLNG